MISQDAGMSEQQIRLEQRRSSELEHRVVEALLQRQSEAAGQNSSFTSNAGISPSLARATPARQARPGSMHIVAACVHYAASVRYHRVTLAHLSAVAGVSERRVRDAFCECYHVSPTVYLRAAALLKVRRRLLDGPPARDAVTRAASDFGFWHLGRFAGQYRALFGESPSETIARARALDLGHTEADDM